MTEQRVLELLETLGGEDRRSVERRGKAEWDEVVRANRRGRSGRAASAALAVACGLAWAGERAPDRPGRYDPPVRASAEPPATQALAAVASEPSLRITPPAPTPRLIAWSPPSIRPSERFEMPARRAPSPGALSAPPAPKLAFRMETGATWEAPPPAALPPPGGA